MLKLNQGIVRDVKAEALVILLEQFFGKQGITDFGGNDAYTPEAWEARGEEYGTESLLIVTHDGGAHAGYFNMDYCNGEQQEALIKFLGKHGMFAETCTSWYSAIYPI